MYVRGKKYRTVKYPLKSSRPFYMDEITLCDVEPMILPNESEKIWKCLTESIEAMLANKGKVHAGDGGELDKLS